MPRPRHSDLNSEELAVTRQAAEEAARNMLEQQAPQDVLRRVAWAAGFGNIDEAATAVGAARTAGYTWEQISDALGMNAETARTRYGGGYERQRRYRARKKGDG